MWLAFAMAAPALALDVPRGAEADGRVQRVVYDENDVVAIYSFPGVATHIVLAPGEEVLDMASGFSAGWDIVQRRNNLYLKPKSVVDDETGIAPVAGKWDTNLIVTTNQRVYTFQLFLVGPRAGATGLEYDPRISYRVVFSYPQVEAVKAHERDVAAETKARLAQPNPVRNANYTMQIGRKSQGIVPTAAYDDGRFTYLQFPPNREVPAVFVLAEDRSETLVNTHMAGGDTMVIQRISPRFMLRLGKQAVAVFNESYDSIGAPTTQGTTVAGVERVVLNINNTDDAPLPPPLVAPTAVATSAAQAAPTSAVAAASPSNPASLGQPPTLEPIVIDRLPVQVDTKLAVPFEPPVRLPKLNFQLAAEPVPVWATADGQSLRQTVESWAKTAGWSVVWDAKVDYALAGTYRYESDFLEALSGLLRAHANVETRLRADAYTRQKLIHISE